MSEFYNVLESLYDSGDLEAVDEYLSSAMAMTEPLSSERAELLVSAALMRVQKDELDEADKLLSESLKIYSSLPEPDALHAVALTTKAILLSRKRDFRAALFAFRQSLEHIRTFSGESLEYARCKLNIATVYEALGDFPAATTELEESVRILEEHLGPNHETTKTARADLERIRN